MLSHRFHLFFTLIFIFFACSSRTFAVPVLIDFEEMYIDPEHIVAATYEENGFRFTPNCHYLPLPAGFNDHSSQFMGITLSACPEFLSTIRMESINGSLFDLQSLVVIDPAFSISSSKGGLIATQENGTMADFSDDEWQNVSWIEFLTGHGEAPGFDDIRLDVAVVPEPMGLAIVLPGLFWLFNRKLRR